MTLIKAKQRARQLAQEWERAGKPKKFYVVYDPTDGDNNPSDSYHVANDESLEGFYHGIQPIFSTAN